MNYLFYVISGLLFAVALHAFIVMEIKHWNETNMFLNVYLAFIASALFAIAGVLA